MFEMFFAAVVFKAVVITAVCLLGLFILFKLLA